MRRLLLVLALLGALAAHAAARAGGGHGYSGGSSSSSSYSYGGGRSSRSNGRLLGAYLGWVMRNPIPGVPLTLLIVYVLYATRNRGLFSAGSRVTWSGPLPERGFRDGGGQLAARKAEELARLRARDPAFDEREFLRRAGAAFLKIQEAWSAGDMAPARAFISDGVNERFGRQLASLKARGLRNLMERVEIRDASILACRSDSHFDALWVRVAAGASDRTVDLSGAEVSRAGLQEFEEIWTFLRRPGVKTLKRPGLIEGSCPSCGSPLPIADTARCGACKSWVNSGEYDWVLTEITQSCEWSMREPSRDVAGWAAASAADPALNLPALEDRASVLFWRWLDASRSDAAVGAVEVAAFEDAGEWSRVHIAVKWSDSGELRTHYFVLRRAATAKTDARQGLRTARCPSCGAPTAAGSEAACAYCGAALNDGMKDWILDEVVSYGAWTMPVARAAAAPASASGLDWGADMSASDAYAILASATLSDGEETLAEKSFLESYAASRKLPPAKALQISAAARAGLLDVPKAADGAQAETMLRGMIRMSLADGSVSAGERAALQSFAGRFALRPDDVGTMIGEERDAIRRPFAGAA